MKILVDKNILYTIRDNLYHINDLLLLDHRPCEKQLVKNTIGMITEIFKESPEGKGVSKLTDSLVEDSLLDRIEALEQRVLALENKRPEYVPPPVYGPKRWK